MQIELLSTSLVYKIALNSNIAARVPKESTILVKLAPFTAPLVVGSLAMLESKKITNPPITK